MLSAQEQLSLIEDYIKAYDYPLGEKDNGFVRTVLINFFTLLEENGLTISIDESAGG